MNSTAYRVHVQLTAASLSIISSISNFYKRKMFGCTNIDFFNSVMTSFILFIYIKGIHISHNCRMSSYYNKGEILKTCFYTINSTINFRKSIKEVVFVLSIVMQNQQKTEHQIIFCSSSFFIKNIQIHISISYRDRFKWISKMVSVHRILQ